MTTYTKLLNDLGVLSGCYKMIISREPGTSVWEVWGLFQREFRFESKLATFETASEAIAFKVEAGY